MDSEEGSVTGCLERKEYLDLCLVGDTTGSIYNSSLDFGLDAVGIRELGAIRVLCHMPDMVLWLLYTGISNIPSII